VVYIEVFAKAKSIATIEEVEFLKRPDAENTCVG
jgi:hypothetical protein